MAPASPFRDLTRARRPRTAALTLFLLLLVPADADATGFGSPTVYSLVPGSPHLTINPTAGGGDSAADLFVDDRTDDNTLTIDVDAPGLGLAPGHDVDALSSGRDFVPSLIVQPLSSQNVIYQFSVDRSAAGGFDGGIQNVGPPGVLQIFSQPGMDAQFPDDQAADIFNNAGAGTLRFDWLGIREEAFELVGAPSAPIDDLDAFGNFGGLGINGTANPPFGPTLGGGGVPSADVYFSVDPATATALGGGISAADILVVPAGGGPIQTFASEAQLGLQAGDDIDALCVLDIDSDLAYGAAQDAVILSLTAGSPSLPQPGPGGFDLTGGGVVLVTPATPYAPIPPGLPGVEWLPAEFFGLQPADELDAFHCADPRETDPQLEHLVAVQDAFMVSPAGTNHVSPLGPVLNFPPNTIAPAPQAFVTLGEVPELRNPSAVPIELVELSLVSTQPFALEMRSSVLTFDPLLPPRVTLQYVDPGGIDESKLVPWYEDDSVVGSGLFLRDGIEVLAVDTLGDSVSFTTTHATPFLLALPPVIPATTLGPLALGAALLLLAALGALRRRRRSDG